MVPDTRAMHSFHVQTITSKDRTYILRTCVNMSSNALIATSSSALSGNRRAAKSLNKIQSQFGSYMGMLCSEMLTEV